MPRFSLPRLSLFEKPYVLPVILFLILVFLIFSAEGIYYYFKVVRQRGEIYREIQRFEEKKGETGKERYDVVKEEIEVQQEELREERPLLTEECRLVPPVDPMLGINRIDKKTSSIADYYYEAEILAVEETDYQGCDYVKLTLKIIDEFEIAIPSALLAKTDLGEVSALLYQGHIGERVLIKIRYEKDQADPEILKMLEWQPLVFITG